MKTTGTEPPPCRRDQRSFSCETENGLVPLLLRFSRKKDREWYLTVLAIPARGCCNELDRARGKFFTFLGLGGGIKVKCSWMRARLSGVAKLLNITLDLNSEILLEWSGGRKSLGLGVQGGEKSLILASECARLQLAEVRAAGLGPLLAQQLG